MFKSIVEGIPIVAVVKGTKSIASEIKNKNYNDSPSSVSEFGEQSVATVISQIIQFIILALALFMAAKCKINGKVSVMQLLLACCCSPCYILYRIVVPCKI